MNRRTTNMHAPSLNIRIGEAVTAEKRTLISFGMLLIAIVSFVMLAGCKNSDTDGYKTFTMTESPASFSYQYPDFFSDPVTDRENEPSFTLVRTTSGGLEPMGSRVETLSIFILPINDSYPTPSDMLDYEIREHWGKIEGFNLLERVSTTVAGNLGEMVIFSYSGPALETLDVIEGGTTTTYVAYFHGEGLMWKIQLSADEPLAKKARTHFDHIIQTFKFLD